MALTTCPFCNKERRHNEIVRDAYRVLGCVGCYYTRPEAEPEPLPSFSPVPVTEETRGRLASALARVSARVRAA